MNLLLLYRDKTISENTMAQSDVFNFFSKSAAKPPGKGSHEIGDPSNYPGLSLDFRRTLSNFHIAPFTCGGRTYKSIEHYFHATKVALVDPEYAYKFCVESGDVIGLCEEGMKVKIWGGKKHVKLDDQQRNIWATMRYSAMKEAALAKYEQNEDYAKVLRATGNAELWHRGPRIAPERFFHLEEIRLL